MTPLRRLLAVAALTVGLTGCSDDGDDQPEGASETIQTSERALSDDGGDAVPAAWSERSAAPVAATEVGAAWFDGRIWVVGGFAADGSPLDAVQLYDPVEDSWSTGPALPAGVHHAAVVATDDALVVLGGYGGGGFGEPTDSVWTLTSDARRWSRGPSLPSPRGAGAAAWDGSRTVFGGGVGPGGLSADVWRLAGDGWTPVGELSEARDHLAAASDGEGRVWFLGGRLGSLDSNRSTVDLVDDDEVTPVGDLTQPRGGVAAFHAPGLGACLAGGEAPDRTLAFVECIDEDGETTALPSLAHPRHGLGAVVADGVAYSLLGGPEPGLAVSNVVEALPLG